MRQELPFFVYGTLRPGEHNHDLFLRGRTCAEEPARLPGALLYEGPGYPYAVDGDGTVTGELVTAAPGHYRELTAVLDHLEEYVAPADPRNLYERVVRTVRTERGAVVAWVYLAAEHTAAELRARGTPIPGGDWSTTSG
ncbi:gamma-glutamylcyclotransferase family protein [Streptomyces sp. FIT100]|uniref:gamma-glutamylcyclotransferase family protein n=1 Tax=Streptomyces sp. FIT100 TaxID=2837956 RepID=UPI0021CA4E43|nr:gamma-glutamylcyclotransferase family protein [Streptomyces sp. FIT100]UUN26777.1 gamma-glutamylcyclotransferase [Streptomyces sp. FIT100]